MNPFLLPGTREEVIAALSSAATPPHGDMGGSSGTPDAQTVWADARQTPGVRQMLYVHVPFCISRCSFCGFYRQAATEEALESYADLLIREMEREVSRGVFEAPIEVVYFGGGTPTALSARSLGRLIRFIYAHFNLTPMSNSRSRDGSMPSTTSASGPAARPAQTVFPSASRVSRPTCGVRSGAGSPAKSFWSGFSASARLRAGRRRWWPI